MNFHPAKLITAIIHAPKMHHQEQVGVQVKDTLTCRLLCETGDCSFSSLNLFKENLWKKVSWKLKLWPQWNGTCVWPHKHTLPLQHHGQWQPQWHSHCQEKSLTLSTLDSTYIANTCLLCVRAIAPLFISCCDRLVAYIRLLPTVKWHYGGFKIYSSSSFIFTIYSM